MPDTEISRSRGWTSGWLLARQTGLMHLAGRAAENVSDHKSRSLRHRCRGVAPFQPVIVIVAVQIVIIVVQIIIARVQSIGETFDANAVSIDHVFQPMRLQARHPTKIQAVIGHGNATESGHVVVLLVMDRHHARRRWFLRATGTCRCLCRHPRTCPVPGRQNLADDDDVAYAKKDRALTNSISLHCNSR